MIKFIYKKFVKEERNLLQRFIVFLLFFLIKEKQFKYFAFCVLYKLLPAEYGIAIKLLSYLKPSVNLRSRQ